MIVQHRHMTCGNYNYIMLERMLKLITPTQQMVVSSEWGEWMQVVNLLNLGDVA